MQSSISLPPPLVPLSLVWAIGAALALGACAKGESGGSGGTAGGAGDGAGGGQTSPPAGGGGGDAGDTNNPTTTPPGQTPPGGTTTPGTTTPPPAPVTETVHTIGRFNADPKGGLKFAWSGSTILATFSGTGITMLLNETTEPISWSKGAAPQGNRYAVTVDGTTQVLKPGAGAGTYPLASGLPAGNHTVKVVKLTEARVGVANFGGFQVTGGQLVATARTASRRMIVIGDSISCGYGNLGTSSACTFSPETEDASQTYGMLAGAAVGADVQIVAYSGKGIFRNNFPGEGIGNQTMANLWTLTLPDDPQEPWDPAQWSADVVVVNLGTNDFNLGTPPQDSFVGAAADLLRQVRKTYPLALVLASVGPMLSDAVKDPPNERTTAIRFMQAALDQVADKQMHFLDLVFKDDGPLGGCNYHPNLDGHKIMAQALQDALHQYLNW